MGRRGVGGLDLGTGSGGRAGGGSDKGEEVSVSLCRGEGNWRAGSHLARVPQSWNYHSKSLGWGCKAGQCHRPKPQLLDSKSASLTVLTFWMLPNNPERGLLSVPVCRGRV